MQIGISPKYVENWSIIEGIREILQNYLDVKDAYKVKGYIDWQNGKAVVRDFGPGLEMKHLVLGISDKTGADRGQFGEGLKLAMLVFAREGRYIEITTNGQRIVPVIKYDEQFGTEVITLDVQPYKYYKGTFIKFECTKEELEKGKKYFINFYKRQPEFKWVIDNEISLPGGQVWVNGTKVCELIGAKYSYHLTGQEAKEIMNRDRTTVNTENLAELLKQKWASTNSLKMVRLLIEQVKNKEATWEVDNIRIWAYHIENETLWRRAVKEVFKDLVLASDNTAINNQAKYQANANLINVRNWRWNEVLKDLGVPTAEKLLQQRQLGVKIVSGSELTITERRVLNTAIELVCKHYNNPGKVIVTEYFTDGEVLGAYNREEDIIYIKRTILSSIPAALHTLLHETVHKYSGASDCTHEFEAALTDVAVNMMVKEVM